MSEPPRPVVEMLDRAERLGLVASADGFIQARKLRNRLVHEYVENKDELAANLNVPRGSRPSESRKISHGDYATDSCPAVE